MYSNFLLHIDYLNERDIKFYYFTRRYDIIYYQHCSIKLKHITNELNEQCLWMSSKPRISITMGDYI